MFLDLQKVFFLSTESPLHQFIGGAEFSQLKRFILAALEAPTYKPETGKVFL
jgi:hypothetical protein